MRRDGQDGNVLARSRLLVVCGGKEARTTRGSPLGPHSHLSRVPFLTSLHCPFTDICTRKLYSPRTASIRPGWGLKRLVGEAGTWWVGNRGWGLSVRGCRGPGVGAGGGAGGAGAGGCVWLRGAARCGVWGEGEVVWFGVGGW